AIWFTAQGANLYGSLDPATGQAKLFPVATPGARPYGLVAGPNGTIWMALFGTNKIGRITAADGALREYPLPDPAARPRRLAVDAHGIVWYSDYARGQLGRLDPATGQVREFPCPGGGDSQPYGIAVGTDGRIWYNESGKNEIVAFDPASAHTETVAIPTAVSGVGADDHPSPAGEPRHADATVAQHLDLERRGEYGARACGARLRPEESEPRRAGQRRRRARGDVERVADRVAQPGGGGAQR